MIFVLLHRMAGGFIGTGSTFAARMIWAVTTGILYGYAALVHHMDWAQVFIITLLTILTAYLGRLIPHSEFQNTPMTTEKILGMSGITCIRLALILAPIGFFHPAWMWLTLFGVFGGIAYWLGWHFLDGKNSGFYYSHGSEQLTVVTMDRFAVYGGEWGEVLTGILVYDLPFTLLLVL